MKLELATLRKQETLCKEHDGRRPTPQSNIHWTLPAWALSKLVDNAVHDSEDGLVLEFPWDSPDVKRLYRLTVSKVRIVIDFAESTTPERTTLLHRKLQIELKHLGDCITRDVNDNLLFHMAPPRRWTKDVEVKGFSGVFDGKTTDGVLGIEGEYAMLSPFTHWYMRLVGLTPAITEELKHVKSISLLFDGVSY